MEMTMEKAIEEQVRDAEEVVESRISVEADRDLGVEMTPAQLKSAGYVYIYDTKTFDRSVCNRNTLVHHLSKKRPDGSQVFTTLRPTQKPQVGTHKCMLHPEAPGRYQLDKLGLPTCLKSNLANPYQVKRHMEKRHKMEYAAIKEEEAREEKEKEVKLREALIKLGSKGEKHNGK